MKNKKPNPLAPTGIFAVALVLLFSFIYGCYWVTITASYNFFYEDMVRGTIVEMVKPGYLK